MKYAQFFGGEFMDFATNFRRICQEKGTSPTAVCLSLGLSSSKVNLWNNGSLPKQKVMIELAKALDCSVMDFFADDDNLHTVEMVLDDDEKDVIRVFRMLSRQQKHEFMSKAYSFEQQLIGKGGNEIV
jgi:hypothetical protein